MEHALSLIGALYRHEKTIRKKKFEGPAKLAHRGMNTARRRWRRSSPGANGTTATDRPVAEQIGSARRWATPPSAKRGCGCFSTTPRSRIDTNHLERGLRQIPMGRRNWLFAWTELGAQRIGAIQSLLVTCRLHGVDPYTYLVDVLQRIDRHPLKDVIELTPRVWTTLFANNPLRSDLDRARDPPLQ